MFIRVEDTSRNDLDKLYEIETECFGKDAFTKRQIAQLLTDYNSVGLQAKLDGDPIGFVIGRIDIEERILTGHILTLDVLPFHRRKGIGRRLLEELESIFRQKSVKLSYLEAREDNVAALELYERMGYERISRLNGYYGSAHGICMKKVLT